MKLFLLFALLIVSIGAREFGYNKDVRFANLLWKKMKMMKFVGNGSISTNPYRGLPPHGTYVEMIESKISVGRTYGFVIILKNYMSPNINIMNIINKPSSHLKSISVMFKRKHGYDSDHKNWFYVQYDAHGMIMKSAQGFRLAGKIDNGNMRGCISCHSSAPAGDYVFSHDKLSSLKESKMYKIRDKKKMKMSAMGKKSHKSKHMKKSTITYEEKNMLMKRMERMEKEMHMKKMPMEDMKMKDMHMKDMNMKKMKTEEMKMKKDMNMQMKDKDMKMDMNMKKDMNMDMKMGMKDKDMNMKKDMKMKDKDMKMNMMTK